MGQAVATITEAPKRSVLVAMASKFNMEPSAFEQTLRATVVPANATKEQFAAFLVVANEYGLNPLTKEIYAFPARNGGIQPIVPIDGWTNIINSNPALDGIEFDDQIDDQGNLVSVTCRLWRKDRSRPIMVTEYMTECRRNTETWKTWPKRMLRHKALIQCSRYAFGLAGIVDPDEFDRMGTDPANAKLVSLPKPPNPDEIASPTTQPEVIKPEAAEGVAPVAVDPDMPSPEGNPDAFFKWLEAKMREFTDGEGEKAADWWNEQITPQLDKLFPPDQEQAFGIWRQHEPRLAP